MCKEIIILLSLSKITIIIKIYRGGLMKNKILFLSSLIIFASLPAGAELTVDDVSSREYLMNHGYAEATADIVELSKSAVNGNKADLPIYHKYDNKPLIYKWIDKAFIYLDPALDNGRFMREDTKFSPSVDDL